MKTCENYLRKLSDYIDGELDNKTRAEFEQHLSVCLHCQQELQMLKNIIMKLQQLPDQIEPPKFVWRSLLSNLPARQDNKRIRYIKYWFSAAIMLLLLTPFLYLQLRHTYLPSHSQDQIVAITQLSRSMQMNSAIIKKLMQANHRMAETDKKIILENLFIIQSAWDNILKLYNSSPNNTELLDETIALYNQQLYILEATIRATSNTKGRKI